MTKHVLAGSPVVFTIGHSVRGIEDLTNILTGYEVKKVVDVRTVPRSAHNPQFNKETLPHDLSGAGISYLHMPGLGGLRHPLKDSLNAGWRNASFRGFADYMQSKEFRENIDKLIDIAEMERIVLMCAESVPWRCHRSLIADALQVQGIQVKHIMGLKSCNDHMLTLWIKVRGAQITYPAVKAISKGPK